MGRPPQNNLVIRYHIMSEGQPGVCTTGSLVNSLVNFSKKTTLDQIIASSLKLYASFLSESTDLNPNIVRLSPECPHVYISTLGYLFKCGAEQQTGFADRLHRQSIEFKSP